MTEMKKIFFSTGLLLSLLACTKDRSLTVQNTEDTKVTESGTKLNSAFYKNIVHIVNSAYSPVSLKISANDTAAWMNDDKIVHTVTSDRFDSGDIPPGGGFKYMFDNIGTYRYHCKYHGETGVLVVAGIR